MGEVVFLYVDEHHSRARSGVTALILSPSDVVAVRERVLAVHPAGPLPEVTQRDRRLAVPEELHHTSFLRSHPDSVKLKVLSDLADVVIDLGIDALHVSYRNAGRIHDDRSEAVKISIGAGMLHMLDRCLRSRPSALVFPVIDAGLGADGRLNPGFATAAPRMAIMLLHVTVASRLVDPASSSLFEPQRLGDSMFVDSAESPAMQLCDVIGGLLRVADTVQGQTSASPFMQRQAEIADRLVSAGRVDAHNIEWSADTNLG